MKRSVVIAFTALVAGLFLAISATAGPFRGYDRAADDQYTTTTPTTTVGATVTVGGQGTTPTTTPTTSTSTTPTAEPTVDPTDDDSDTAGEDDGGEDDGSGAAPDEDSGAGAPTGTTPSTTGAGTGTGRGDGAPAPRIALLSVGSPDPALAGSILRVTGPLAWSGRADGIDVNALGDLAAGTPFAGLGEGDLDMDKLRGLAGLLGRDSARGSGLASSLGSLLPDFAGTSRALVGLVLTHERLEDADDRLIAESFMRSFARSAEQQDIPVIGVELHESDPSSVPFFKKIKGISSVDDLDTEQGRESLVRLLAGAKPGHYGRQDTASAEQAPRVDPVSSASVVRDADSTLGGSPLLVGLLLTMVLLAGRSVLAVARRQSLPGLRRR